MFNKQHNSNKRVCIVRHLSYEPLVRREAEALKEAGFDVDVICTSTRKDVRMVNGVCIHYLPVPREKGTLARYVFDYLSFFCLVALTLTSQHLKRPFACIQVNNMPDFLVFATLIPRLLGCKVTMFMYEPVPELWATMHSNMPYLIKPLKLIERLSLRYACAVFAVTEQMKQVFVSRGTKADKITVVLNVPDSRLFEAHVPDKIDCTNKYFTLVCHGAIEERYGHDTMLQAIDRIKAQIPGVRLRILGHGSQRNKFLAQIASMELGDYVQCLNWVPLPQMVAELCNADVGVVAMKSSPYSNLVHTGKMYDYLNFAIPVLASRLRAVEAYFGDDSLSFFEPGNPESLAASIFDLYQHPEKRRALVQNSQRLYDQYRWEKQKEVYLSVYRTLLK